MTNTKKVFEFTTHPELVLLTLMEVHSGQFPGEALRVTLGELLEAGLVDGYARFRLTAAGKARLAAAVAVASVPVELPGRPTECRHCGVIIELCDQDVSMGPDWAGPDGSTSCAARIALWHEPFGCEIST